MAYNPATGEIFLGFTNIFGYSNEVDFVMDDVIAGMGRRTPNLRRSNTLAHNGNGFWNEHWPLTFGVMERNGDVSTPSA
jgi:hypothetical protein